VSDAMKTIGYAERENVAKYLAVEVQGTQTEGAEVEAKTVVIVDAETKTFLVAVTAEAEVEIPATEAPAQKKKVAVDDGNTDFQVEYATRSKTYHLHGTSFLIRANCNRRRVL
jgi:hypothetical protein